MEPASKRRRTFDTVDVLQILGLGDESDDDGIGEIICDGSDEEFDVELEGEDEHDYGQESNDNSSDESNFDEDDGDESSEDEQQYKDRSDDSDMESSDEYNR